MRASSPGQVLYRAFKLAPQGEVEPVTVSAPMPTPTRAYTQLMAKAEELRKADGKLTEAQAFAKVYENPANRELVQADKRERSAA
jgi:hypothetical protein